MPRKPLLLWFLCFVPNVLLCQVAGRSVPGAAPPANYPFIDLSDSAKAHANLSIPSAESERAARYDTNKRPPIYNQADPSRSGEISYQEYVDYGSGYEPLQLSQADVLAIGTIGSATPHMNKSGTAVYSTFIFVPSSVLKGSLPINSSVLVDRKGSYVVFPSGKKRYIGIVGQGLPVPGYKYLVSLKAVPHGDSYTILGGYALLGSHAICLDRSREDQHPLTDDELVANIKQQLARRSYSTTFGINDQHAGDESWSSQEVGSHNTSAPHDWGLRQHPRMRTTFLPPSFELLRPDASGCLQLGTRRSKMPMPAKRVASVNTLVRPHYVEQLAM